MHDFGVLKLFLNDTRILSHFAAWAVWRTSRERPDTQNDHGIFLSWDVERRHLAIGQLWTPVAGVMLAAKRPQWAGNLSRCNFDPFFLPLGSFGPSGKRLPGHVAASDLPGTCARSPLNMLFYQFGVSLHIGHRLRLTMVAAEKDGRINGTNSITQAYICNEAKTNRIFNRHC